MNADLISLRKRMSSPDAEERRRALAKIGARAGREVHELLVASLGDESWRVRKEAVAWLVGAVDPAAAAGVVVEALASTDDVGQRNSAIEALTGIGVPAVRPLIVALRKRPPFRKFLIDALGAVAGPEIDGAITPLIDALGDVDVNVQVAAAEALGRIGGRRCEDALGALVDGSEMMLQLTALDALTALSARVDPERLERALATPVVRCSALRLLGTSHDERSVPVLLAALEDPTRRARDAAIGALAKLSAELEGPQRQRVRDRLRSIPDSARERLADGMNARDADVRQAAIHVLGVLGDVRFVPKLASLLLDSNLAASAGESIAAMGSAAIPALTTCEREAEGPLAAEMRLLRGQIESAGSGDTEQALGPARTHVARGKARGKRRLRVEDFEVLRGLIYDYCGIFFKDDGGYLMQRRLAPRLDATGCATFADYARLLRSASGEAELAEAVERITTNETYFFRESYQLYAFADEILPSLYRDPRRARRVNVWSAGCSTGEEAYTIAMLIRERGEIEQWDARVVGSDISRRVLDIARRGWYGSSSMRAIDPSSYRRFFRPRDGGHEVTEEVRELVEFRPSNLLDAKQLEALPQFDVIFCRNVLIYFDRAARERVVEAFYRQLAPGGYLLLGHSESLLNLSTAFEIVQLQNDTVYQKPN